MADASTIDRRPAGPTGTAAPVAPGDRPQRTAAAYSLLVVALAVLSCFSAATVFLSILQGLPGDDVATGTLSDLLNVHVLRRHADTDILFGVALLVTANAVCFCAAWVTQRTMLGPLTADHAKKVREELLGFLVIKGIVLWTLYEMNEERHVQRAVAAAATAAAGTKVLVPSGDSTMADNSLLLWTAWFMINGWLAGVGALGRLRLTSVSTASTRLSPVFGCHLGGYGSAVWSLDSGRVCLGLIGGSLPTSADVHGRFDALYHRRSFPHQIPQTRLAVQPCRLSQA